MWYNGSLPLTFVVHHQLGKVVGDEGESEIGQESEGEGVGEGERTVPLFAATDGSQMFLTHIQPIPQASPNPENSSNSNSPIDSHLPSPELNTRSGWNGYNHVGAGGIKLLCNSDPVATWSDVFAWLNSNTEPGGSRPYDALLGMASQGGYLGHSLLRDVHDAAGKGFNGQFGMVGVAHVSFVFLVLVYGSCLCFSILWERSGERRERERGEWDGMEIGKFYVIVLTMHRDSRRIGIMISIGASEVILRTARLRYRVFG